MKWNQSANSLKLSSELGNVGKVLTKEKELPIYRIFQESLNKTLKHAEASAIKDS